MNYSFCGINDASFSRFCRFAESKSFKICKVITDITIYLQIHLQLFLRILGNIKIKISQISVKHITNIFNLFLNLLKWQYNVICLILVHDAYNLSLPQCTP